MPSYTDNLFFSNPDPGECNWDDDWYRNQDLKDVVLRALLSQNRIVEGGVPSDVGSLTVQIESGSALQGVTTLSWDVTQVVVVVAPAGLAPLENWVYINDAGVIVSETDPPSGDFIPIAMVDTDETETIRVVDIRPLISAAFTPGDEINKTIPGTNIVDAFIYDTTKDSDGGAWRWRTTLTSWYNETLNTATRGARREFPEVALVIAEADQVTIYDATVPGVAMWMVFNSGTYSYIRGTGLTAVEMLNGEMFVSNTVGGIGASWLDFIKDGSIACILNNGTGLRITLPISGRNNTDSQYRVQDVNISIADQSSNDVAMTLLSGAPIDPVTLIAIPTIAVATDGGVSVIDGPAGVGTVVDITWTSEGGVWDVIFDGNNLMRLTQGDTSFRSYAKVYEIPAANIAESGGSLKGAAVAYYSPIASNPDLSLLPGGSGYNAKNAVGAVGGNVGLTLLRENVVTPADGMVNYITDEYQSGWMQGDIKLATLADSVEEDIGVDITTEWWDDPPTTIETGWTDDGGGSYSADGSQGGAISMFSAANLVDGQVYDFLITVSGYAAGNVAMLAGSTSVGPALAADGSFVISLKASGDLVISVQGDADFSGSVSAISVKKSQNVVENGEFSSDRSWTKGDGWTIAAGVASSDGTQAAVSTIEQTIAEITAQPIVATFTLLNRSAGSVRLKYSGGTGSSETVDGTYSAAITPTGASFNIEASDDFVGDVTDVIAEPLAVADRSVNDNPLQVVGQLTKTKVAAAADLVAYSGFSTDSFLLQPYNSDLDFGTGDFHVMGWFDIPVTGAYQVFLSRTDLGGVGSDIRADSPSGDDTFRFVVAGTSGQKVLTSVELVEGAGWVFACFGVNSNVPFLSINAGVPVTGVDPGDLDNVAAVLSIGRLVDGVTTFPNGKVALIRLGTNVPSDQQILDIYNSEKLLLQYPCLLTGGANVTALSYDETSQTLKVGNDGGSGNNMVDTFVATVHADSDEISDMAVAVDHDNVRYALADQDEVVFHKNKE